MPVAVEAGGLTMADQVTLEIRLQLRRLGYDPLPLVGKACFLKQWETKTNISAEEIALWSTTHPHASNTGVVNKFTPFLDIDILNEEAAKAAEEIVRRRVQGLILVRVGLPPKRATPFRTDVPFKKIKVVLTASNGAEEKVEFLGDGQMIAVAGIHPDTKQPYRWLGGELWETPRVDLPCIGETEAQGLVDEIVGLLCREHGYSRKPPRPTQHHASLMRNSTGSRISEAWGGDGGDKRSWREGGPMKWAPDWVAPKALYLLARLVTKCPQHKRRVIGGLEELVKARQGRNEMLHRKAVFFRQELVREGVVNEAAAEALLLVAARLNGYIGKDGIGEAARTVRSGLGLEAT
jgi:hypothetical protein